MLSWLARSVKLSVHVLKTTKYERSGMEQALCFKNMPNVEKEEYIWQWRILRVRF